VEGASRFSVAIKYLTQSTWSHAALYIGDAVDPPGKGEDARVIVEADIREGIRLMPLSIYYERHPSPTRSAIFDAGKTSRINVAHFMSTLITDEAVWEKWKGQMPVIYNKA
jgi:hypothetical protein